MPIVHAMPFFCETTPNMHTMPFMQAIQCQMCKQCLLCNIYNAINAYNAIYVHNTIFAWYTMPNVQTMPIVKHIWHWMLHIWNWIAAYLALTDSKLSEHIVQCALSSSCLYSTWLFRESPYPVLKSHCSHLNFFWPLCTISLCLCM